MIELLMGMLIGFLIGITLVNIIFIYKEEEKELTILEFKEEEK